MGAISSCLVWLQAVVWLQAIMWLQAVVWLQTMVWLQAMVRLQAVGACSCTVYRVHGGATCDSPYLSPLCTLHHNAHILRTLLPRFLRLGAQPSPSSRRKTAALILLQNVGCGHSAQPSIFRFFVPGHGALQCTACAGGWPSYPGAPLYTAYHGGLACYRLLQVMFREYSERGQQ